MSSIIYNKAFAVELSHDFYTTDNEFEINRLFDIAPTSACADLMRKGRMRFVRTETGFTVFFQSYLDENNIVQPLVKLSDGAEFLFAVLIKDIPNFLLNVTDLNIRDNAGNIVKAYGSGMTYFLTAKDSDSDTLLDPSLIDQIRPQVFTYSFRGRELVNPFPSYTGPVNITVKDESNTTIFTFSHFNSDASTGIYNLPLDFSAQPNGLYHIEARKDLTSPSDVVVHQADLYIDNTLARENVFGLIRLTYTSANNLYTTTTNPAGYLTFTYPFINRKVRWRYYVSIKDYPAGFFPTNYLQIVDTASSNAYTFTPVDAPGVPHPSFQINGMNTVVITSTGGGPGAVHDGQIPFSETAISTFQLQQIGGTLPKILINVLPNASVIGVDSNQLNTTAPTDLPPYAEIFLTIDTLST